MANHPDGAALISSAFSISSDELVPQQCTVALGIVPTVAALKGTKLRPNARGTLLRSLWQVSRRKIPGDNIDDGLSCVLNEIWPAREKIIAYLAETGFDASFSTTVNIYDDRPLYCLSPDTLARMAFFGVEYIFDVHDYSD